MYGTLVILGTNGLRVGEIWLACIEHLLIIINRREVTYVINNKFWGEIA